MIPRTVKAIRQQGDVFCKHSRGMATQQQLVLRIKSVVGIEKITKAVQMEASAKLRKTEARLAKARAFQKAIGGVWPDPPADTGEKKNKDFLLVVISADRGLCGSFNSSVAREAKKEAAKILKEYKSLKVVVLGNKAKTIMEREYRTSFYFTFTELLRTKQPSFTQVLKIADEIKDVEFDQGLMLFNTHKNVMSFDRHSIALFPRNAYHERVMDDLVKYELEGPTDILDNFFDYKMAVNIYWYLSEMETAQTAARMTAMQNASKNTEDLLKALRQEYNKTRQSKITTELCEIISGAAALDKV